MNTDNMTPLEKIERLGYIEYNRLGEEGWHLKEDFYTSEDYLVGVHLDNDVDNEVGDY